MSARRILTSNMPLAMLGCSKFGVFEQSSRICAPGSTIQRRLCSRENNPAVLSHVFVLPGAQSSRIVTRICAPGTQSSRIVSTIQR